VRNSARSLDKKVMNIDRTNYYLYFDSRPYFNDYRLDSLIQSIEKDNFDYKH